MLKRIKYIYKKSLYFKQIFIPGLDLSFNSLVSPDSFKLIKKNKKHKIIINHSVVSGNVSISEGCKLNYVHCSGNVKIGRFVSLNGPGTRVSSRIEGVEIGAFTSIASNVVIQEDNHRIDKISTYFMNQNLYKSDIKKDVESKGKISIEEDVWIGSNCVILSGVNIGRGSIIGAGSVVTKSVPKYSIVVGNPAKVIKKRFGQEIIGQLESSEWWNYDIDKILKMKNIFSKNINNDMNIFEEWEKV